MEAKVNVAVEVTAFDLDVDVVHTCDITEGEFLCEFARVMHEWGFQAFRRGEVSFPTLAEVREAAARSPYTRG